MAEVEVRVAIESLLSDGAQRRGMTVAAYRDLVLETADDAGVTFEKALEVIHDFDEMRPDKFKALAESLVILTEEAARHGVSASGLAKIMLVYDHGDYPLTDLPDPLPAAP